MENIPLHLQQFKTQECLSQQLFLKLERWYEKFQLWTDAVATTAPPLDTERQAGEKEEQQRQNPLLNFLNLKLQGYKNLKWKYCLYFGVFWIGIINSTKIFQNIIANNVNVKVNLSLKNLLFPGEHTHAHTHTRTHTN